MAGFGDIIQYGEEAPSGRCNATPADLHIGLKFFGNRICPFAHRSWWAALEVDAPIEYVHVDMGGKQAGPLANGTNKPQWYVQDVSPLATIPTLVDEGVPYFAVAGTFEADPVFEHVISRGNQRIAPRTTDEDRRLRMFIAWVGGKKLVPLMYQLLQCKDLEKAKPLKQKLTLLMHELDDRIAAMSEGPFVLGTEVSQADMAIIPFFDRFEATLFHYRKYELLPSSDPQRARLKRLMEACRLRPAFQQTSQSSEFYIQAYRGYGGAPDAESLVAAL